MKKTMSLCLVLATISLISCGSNDDYGVQDKIVGSWQYTAKATFVNGEQQPTEVLSECERNSSITFGGYGSGSSIYYDTNGVGECTGDPLPFMWVNMGNGIYRFFKPNEREEHKITFDGDTMKMSGTYRDGAREYTYMDAYSRQ